MDNPVQADPTHRPWTAGRRLRAIVFAILLVFLPAEIICRVLTAAFLKNYTGAAIREAMGDLQRVALERMDGDDAAETLAKESIHPYLGFVATPGLGMGEKSYPVTRDRLDRQVGRGVSPWWLGLEANNWGFWSPHAMPYDRKPGDFVVAVLGGSVAQWLALQGETTLREELQQRVPGLFGRNVVVLNFALSGFKQPQQVMLLAQLLTQGVRPDVVVNVDGFNEAAIAYHNVLNAVSPDYPRADLWPFLISGLEYSNRVLSLQAAVFREKERASSVAGRAIRWSRASNILGIVFMTQARRIQAGEQVLQSEFHTALAEDLPAYREFAARGPSADLREDRWNEQIIRLWFEGSVNLASLCKGWDVLYLHVLQPTLHDSVPRPSKPLSPAERKIASTRAGTWGAWREGVRRFYPMFRAQAAALRETGVAFADLSYLFESTPDTIYYDICHYNQQGNEMFARAIAARLASAVAYEDSRQP